MGFRVILPKKLIDNGTRVGAASAFEICLLNMLADLRSPQTGFQTRPHLAKRMSALSPDVFDCRDL